MPIQNNVYFFIAFKSVSGFFSALCSNANHAWLLQMWASRSGPAMNALQFSSSIGNIIGSLMMSLFLSEHHAIPAAEKEDNVTTDSPQNVSTSLDTSPNNVVIPFVIYALLQWTSAVALIISFFWMRYQPPKQDLKTSGSDDGEDVHDDSIIAPSISRRKYYVTLTIGILLLGAYIHVQNNTSILMPKFLISVNPSRISQASAARMLSFVFTASAVGQVIGAVVTSRVQIVVVLLTCLFIVALGLLLLLAFASTSHLLVVWIALMLLGIGKSCVIPSIYCLINNKIPVSDRVCAVLNLSGSLVEGLMNLLTSSLVESQPLFLLIVDLISISVCFVLLFILRFV